jgi:alanine racemase
MSLRREAIIDLAAISRNVERLDRATDGARTMVIVKANAYGHGAVPVARAALAAGADWLGVADLEEAYELRDAGIDAPVLAWLLDSAADFRSAAERNIDIGVTDLEQLDSVASCGTRAHVQLEVDTGLSRNGAAKDNWAQLFEAAAAHERAGRVVVRGLWSHLSNTNDDEDHAQVADFEVALAAASAAGLDPELVHLSATAGTLRIPAARFGLVRLGIATYGLSPIEGVSSKSLGLTPAMELSAAVASVRPATEGSGVSYGYDYRTTKDTTLALIPLGYADGIPRHASSRGPISINGVTYRVAGRVAMDQVVVDVGDAPVSVGDRAVFFGDPTTGVPSADDWARASDTINYEIVTRIGSRVKRRYLS